MTDKYNLTAPVATDVRERAMEAGDWVHPTETRFAIVHFVEHLKDNPETMTSVLDYVWGKDQ